MNKYLRNLNKIEFAVTYACTGRCKHCSEGDHSYCIDRIDPDIAADAVRKIASSYEIKTVMAFGGEPLLHPDAVFSIMNAAKQMNIPKRQIITNGFFSNDAAKISGVANTLAACGVNDLLLSVDAFHQETIPLDVVKIFAKSVKDLGVPIRLQPAWLVSPTDNNPYNRRTEEILDSFREMEIYANDGNVIFPEGNALKYLSEYFTQTLPENPYVEDPCDVRCLSFSPDGDILGGNVYERDIMDIVENYAPKRVVVLPYDAAWRSAFEKIKAEIESAIGNLILGIEHIGSTSVEGMSAKPIIDIDVVINDYSVFPAVVDALKSIGYIHEGDLGIKDREAFKYTNKPHLMLHHLYVCPKDSKELHRHIAFRDFLRANADAVQKYSKVKETAAEMFPYDINKYIEYKSPCIEELYRMIRSKEDCYEK